VAIEELPSVQSTRTTVGAAGAVRISRGSSRRKWIASAAVLVLVLVWLLTNATTDDGSIANPSPPHPLRSLRWAALSVDHFWVPLFYVITAGLMGLMVWLFVRHSRRAGSVHPGALIFIAFVPQFVMDPLYNWSMYVAYNPDLVHWPVNWPIFNVAPTVEPIWVLLGAYQGWYLAPALGAFALHQRFIARNARRGSWIARHELLSLFAFATAFGVVIDFFLEEWLMNIGFYKYPQVVGPSVSWGRGHLALSEILWTAVLIALCACLLHRDDRGWSAAKRLSARIPGLRTTIAGQVGVLSIVIMLAWMTYGGVMAVFRVTGSVTTVTAGGWPYRNIKTYDPDGLLKAAHVTGPYYAGTWCIEAACTR
jgi:Spirocyclase AveC-like